MALINKLQEYSFDLVDNFALCFNYCRNVHCMRMERSSTDQYLVICSYVIGTLDLLSALLFATVSALMYVQNYHWSSLLALIFSIMWVVIIIYLLLGIFHRCLNFVRYWLVFTCLGIMMDSMLLLYGLTLSVTINWEGAKITIIPFLGLAVEMTFVYIIYMFYLEMVMNEYWIPCRVRGGRDPQIKESISSTDTKEMERKRLRKMYKREEKAALKELQRKLRRGQV